MKHALSCAVRSKISVTSIDDIIVLRRIVRNHTNQKEYNQNVV
jgi:hypothetical protein